MIPSEPDFVKIALQMLWAEIMKNTLLGALQNGVERFCRVVVDLTPGKCSGQEKNGQKIKQSFLGSALFRTPSVISTPGWNGVVCCYRK